MKQSFAALPPVLLSFFLLASGTPRLTFAQSYFESPKSFTITQACDAVTSIRQGTDPVPLTVGQSYTALGENKRPNGTHAFVNVNGQRKWVSLTCGQYENGTGGGNGNGEPPAQTCLPFFDEEENPIPVGVGGIADITPPPLQLTVFDRAVNQVCGEPGKVVSRAEFQELLTQHPEVLAATRDFAGGKVFADRPAPASIDTFLNDLTDAWFNRQGFNHIFCGEPKPGGSIGGLHFWGRYLQLQQDGLACRLPDTSRAEVVSGVIYTMGVRMKVEGGSAQSPVKGYGYTFSAADILKVATRAFAENPTQSSNSTACLLTVDDDNVTFTTVFVRRATGIVTFYPDATPSSLDPACVAAVTVPPSDSAATITLSVSARTPWMDTGVDLKAGDRFAISASGAWTNGGEPASYVGPDGFAGVRLNEAELSSANFAALIGRVCDREFLVGSSYQGSSPSLGRLYLQINDIPYSWNDNNGTIEVELRRLP